MDLGQTVLEISDPGEILIQLAAVMAAQPRIQPTGIIENKVQDAEPSTQSASLVLGLLALLPVTEETIERTTRIDLLRMGSGLAGPGDIVRIGAAVTRVAIAGVTSAIAAKLERGEFREITDLPGGGLVNRHADPDSRSMRLHRLGPGQKNRRGAGVITGAIAIGPALVMGQACEHQQVIANSVQRLQAPGHLVVASAALWNPVLEVDSIGNEAEGHPDRGAGGRHGFGGGNRGRHDLQERKSKRGS